MSTVAAKANEAARSSRVAALMRTRPLWAALAVTILLTVFRLGGTVDSDVAWQLWIAGRIHTGANLYTDVIETNPPLWFWMALPVDTIASTLHLRIEPVLVACIGGLVGLSLAATNRLIEHIDTKRRALLLFYAALTLVAMPWVHLGQREQIALIGTIPYAALIAARREGPRIPPLLAASIGIGAALSFALKHYFLITPALLELWLLVGRGHRWRPIRPETVAIGVMVLAYSVAMLAFERDYLTNVLPLLRLAYGDFGPPSIRYLFGPPAVLGLATLGLLAAHQRMLRSVAFAGALSVAAVGFAAGYFIQFKGWPYHAIPLLGCASVGLAALLAETKTWPSFLRVVAPTLLLFPLALTMVEARSNLSQTPDLQQAISGLGEGDTVGFITENTALPWSVTLQHGFRYASRYNGYWMMSAVYANQLKTKPDPRVTLLGQQVVSQTVMDFHCLPARRIIVARPAQGTWTENTVDILPFFMRDPAFVNLLRHYRPVRRTTLEVYELAAPLPPLHSSKCRRGV